MSPSTVLKELTAIYERVEECDKDSIKHALALIEEMTDQLTRFKWLAKQRFRRSSEKIAPGQLAMAFIEHLAASAQEKPGNDKTANPSPPESGEPRRKRKSGIKLLPVETINKTIPESDRRCECGCTKEHIGCDIRRQIVYQPPKMSIQEERLHKYACRPCGAGVVMAEAQPKLVSGSLASSSILAHLVVSKVVDSTPIERVGKQLARHGASLAPSTLYEWFAYAAKEVAEIQPRIHKELLTSRLISCDDTPMPTKNAHKNVGIQRGRIWLYLGDIDRIAYCRFSEDWKGVHPRTVLAGFGGDIQGDGYGGIASLFHGAASPRRVGCNDHARRKFVEALKMGDSRAEDIVAIYAQLYAVERKARDVCAKDRLAMRRTMSQPIWQDLDARIAALAPLASPKGPLGKAVTYWRKQKVTLCAYLDSGHLPISNAHVERLLRVVALLRKNALFMGSIEAGHRYAALLTMALNCTLCGADPFAYFSWLFDRLAEGVKGNRALDVLPQAWLTSQQPAD